MMHEPALIDADLRHAEGTRLMKHGRRFQKAARVVAASNPSDKRSRRSRLRKLPIYRSALFPKNRSEREETAARLLSTAKHAIEVHFGLQKESAPWLYQVFLYHQDLAELIASAKIPAAGRETSCKSDWLMQVEDDYVLCEMDSTLLKFNERDDSLTAAEYYLFGEKGELLRDAVVEGYGLPTREILVPGALDKLLGPPTLVRAPNERRPLTAEEACGCLAALMRAFIAFRPSLYKLADEADMNELSDLALNARRLAARLRHHANGTVTGLEELLMILCERHAFSLDEFRYQVDRKKKQALVHFMNPCVACFQLLYDQRASGGSDYKPSPFTLFVASFLERMGVPAANWRTVRKYFQQWSKHCHVARAAT